MTGAEVKDWLERSAGIFNQIKADQEDQMLLNDSFPSRNFDVMDGVSYEIDLSRPSKPDPKGGLINADAKRIVNLTFQRQPIDLDKQLIAATNNYRASGGGRFHGALGDTIVLEGPDTNRDVIVRYILEQGTISLRADSNWRFSPAGGATVLFVTEAKAAGYVEEITGVDITSPGDGPDCFARFRIRV